MVLSFFAAPKKLGAHGGLPTQALPTSLKNTSFVRIWRGEMAYTAAFTENLD